MDKLYTWEDFRVQNIEIRRPKIEDIEELNCFFKMLVANTFAREGLAYMLDEIEDEIKSKKRYLKSDLDSNGEDRYFLIALDGEKVIGTIEYGPASQLINDLTNSELKELFEVGTVFVHPDYQKRGIGNKLLNAIYVTLKSKGVEEFCLDSGYTNSQKIWKKKFGEPDYLIKDFWGEGFDHMIWRVKVKDVLKCSRIL